MYRVRGRDKCIYMCIVIIIFDVKPNRNDAVLSVMVPIDNFLDKCNSIYKHLLPASD